MLTLRAVTFATTLAVVACRKDADPGFEIVSVPLSAYATPDAAGDGDGAASDLDDGGHEPFVLCITPEKGDADDDEDCPPRYRRRIYDGHVTQRHRNKGESDVCCYRLDARLPRETSAGE
jgi:hypothetical protein